MQVLVECADNASLALSTKRETALPAELVLNSVLSPWQSRQSLSFNPAKAGMAARSRSENHRRKPLFIPPRSTHGQRKAPPGLATTHQLLNPKYRLSLPSANAKTDHDHC